MPYNILSSLISFVQNSTNRLARSSEISSSRVNSMGSMVESYVNRFLSNNFGVSNKVGLQKRYSEGFSYTGNSNNPPDVMYRAGDAFDIKNQIPLKGNLVYCMAKSIQLALGNTSYVNSLRKEVLSHHPSMGRELNLGVESLYVSEVIKFK